MSKTITIGTADTGAVKLDIGRLLVTRLLVTADSGGGKSWLLRKILEGTSKTTQTIVIDPEGEFATLREVRDMVLAGPDGEVPAEPRSASLLCRRLMELNLSAVIDIQDLTLRQKQEFVASFCQTMVDLPKSLWHPCFVAIDEIHDFAPEDSASVSHDAVASLSTKGRKRGFCLVGATQRLSKLSKDVAAGLKNQFNGSFSLDADIKRAASSLGFGKDRWQEIKELSSRKGEEGEFFATGPALNHRGVFKMRSGQVETTHPEPGVGRAPAPPAPSAKIKGVLGELKDLPQQAEAEIRDLATAKMKIVTLERELKATHATPKNAVPPAQLKELHQQTKANAATIQRLKKGLEDATKVIAEINARGFENTRIDPAVVTKAVQAAAEQIVRAAEQKLSSREKEFAEWKKRATKVLADLQKLIGEDITVSVGVQHNEPFTVKAPPPVHRRAAAADAAGRESLTQTEKAVLDAAASFPGGATRQRISIFSGRSIKSSSFQGVFAGGESKGERPSLVQRGLLRLEGDRYVPTDEGYAMAQATTATSLEDWLRKLLPSEAKVLKCLADNAGERLTRTQVAEKTGQSEKSSSFQGAFPALRDLGLIDGTADFAVSEDLVGV